MSNNNPADALLRLLNTDRYAEFREDWNDNPEALAAIAEKEKELSHTVHCGECGAWDGRSRRCFCGNRRVAWFWDDDLKEVQAEVY